MSFVSAVVAAVVVFSAVARGVREAGAEAADVEGDVVFDADQADVNHKFIVVISYLSELWGDCEISSASTDSVNFDLFAKVLHGLIRRVCLREDRIFEIFDRDVPRQVIAAKPYSRWWEGTDFPS